MPIYEYRCEDCGHELEKIQKISDPVLTDCPACGQPALKKQISAAGFRLKGSGWYETDFKKDNRKNLHETGKTETTAETAGSSPAGSSPAGGTDKAAPSESKPAAAAPKSVDKPADKQSAA